MNTSPRTIWMNVTTSANWKRPPVGIVRVENLLREELERIYGDRFATCIWENEEFVTQNASKYVGGRLKSSIFSPGDVLISIGLDWDYSFYKFFYNLKNDRKVHIVTCCYDLIPVLYPQYCVSDVAQRFTGYFLDVAEGSDHILCISRQTQRDLISTLESCGGALPQTSILPLGDNVPTGLGEPVSPLVSEICTEPFILFVSTIERRKNHEVIYRAVHLLCKDGKRDQLPKVIFVGMQGWGVNDLMKDIELDPLTQELIVQLGHVNDTELRLLYESALFCVYPSLYEGWGLPVGEALSIGKVVLCSDRGSLPEVGGDLVRYIDPWHARAWADEILRMSTDAEWRGQLEHQVAYEYEPRTWQAAGAAVQDVIDAFP